MTKTNFHSTSVCAKAIDRLSRVINCASILDYACTVKNPSELELLAKMLMKIGLHNKARRDDLCQCVDYLDSLTDDLLRPCYIEQHNHGCQQFYGKVTKSKFYSSKSYLLKSIAA